MPDDDTPPGGKQLGYASRATVELYHRENQRSSAKLDERLRELEITNERQLTQLEEMGKTLGAIQKRLEVKPTNWVALLGAVAIVGGWIFMFARYPDRSEFNRLAESTAEMRLRFERFDMQITVQAAKLAELGRQCRQGGTP